MEGSRHEKAALISVSYFIGAVTVFIGLYAANTPESFFSVAVTQPATVISVTDHKAEHTPTQSTKTVVPPYYGNVTYQDGVLAIETMMGRKIISYNPTHSGIEVSTDFVKQGIHTGNIVYTVAPGDQYVFFCEEKDTPGVCVPFIYDVTADKVFMVKVNSSEILFSQAQASEAVWDVAGLSIPGMVVVDNTKPWLLLGSIAE